MNKNKSFYYILFSKVMLILLIVLLLFSYFNKTISIKSAVFNIIGITFFSGTILFYQFNGNKKLLYTAYFLYFISICISLILLLRLKSIKISTFLLVSFLFYMFYQINIFLYKSNDILFLEMISKVIFFNEVYKYNLAWIYYNDSNYKKSIKILEKCRESYSCFFLATIYEQITEYEKAIKLYSKILLNDNNERPDILYNRGAIYKKTGKYNEAIDDFIACTKCQKPDPKAYIALGIIKDECGKNEEAKEYFKKGKATDGSFNEYIPDKYK